MRIAIITGASSGLGRSYARLLDREGLDELWLIARRQERLTELAGELETSCRILACDLTEPGVLEGLSHEIASAEHLEIAWVVAAAGFGRVGKTQDIRLTDQLCMIDLNCRAAVAIAELAIPFMSDGSHILLVASCAAFQPIPYLNVYAASKAFLLRYGRALGVELEPQGITVTTVCPYWIRDTEFLANAHPSPEKLFTFLPGATTVDVVAERSLRATKNHVRVCTPDMMSFLHRVLCSILPHSLMMRLALIYAKL